MSDERIRVEIVRSGGVAGLKRTGRVDTADLDEERAAALRSLVSETTLTGQPGQPSAARTGGADRFQFDVTLVRGDDRRSFVVHESDLSDADQRLIRWVLAEGRVAG
jgi:hypothetical protein